MTLALIINVRETVSIVVELILIVSIVMCAVYLNQIRDLLKDLRDHTPGERKASGGRYTPLNR